MFLVPVIVGVAGFVDGLATGAWATRKWGTKAVVVAAVESAATRAVTVPSGGLKTIAGEVVADVEAVVTKVADVGAEVGGAVSSVTDLHAKLDGLIAAAVAVKK